MHSHTVPGHCAKRGTGPRGHCISQEKWETQEVGVLGEGVPGEEVRGGEAVQGKEANPCMELQAEAVPK